MVTTTKAKCKICRRAGQKLFLKGEKCLTPKCPLIRKPYPPGQKRKRRLGGLSEYGRELMEKQKLKKWYNLRENQFKKYVLEALKKRGKVSDTADYLINLLEKRLDNVVYRAGFASSRSQARQLVSHGHFFVNNKPVNIPSYHLERGDKISIRPTALNNTYFQNLKMNIKDYQAPSWLKLDKEKLEVEVIGEPTLNEASPPAEIPAIFEFYAR
jgi:small subunit ribosomal protein S4